MKFIFSYMKKYRKLVAAVMLIKLAGTLGELMLPYVLEHLVDDVVPEKDVKLVCLWGSIMILLAIFVRQANVRANRLSVRVAKECTYEIRRDLFWKSINLSGSQLDEFGLPSLDSRMTSDSYNLQSFIQSVQSLGIRAPILLLGGILITLTMDTGLAAILNVGLTVVVLVGAVRVNEGTTQPGVILAFLTYFNMILMGVMALNRVFMLLSKANASANRIAAVVCTKEELLPIPAEEAAVTDREGFIVFDHVNFSYGNEKGADVREEFDGGNRQKCLENIDFSIKKGGSLGIFGATGCGKTTIINLLMRFYDADGGNIFIDGRDVRTFDKDELHRLFGVVFQNDVIFADTLRENISFGRDVSAEEIEHAADDAKAREFIEGYEDTYEHRAAVHGSNLSGGQRQRILIARALAAAPEILILDDSSSALDYKTDAALRRAIREHHSDTTTIIVAQLQYVS